MSFLVALGAVVRDRNLYLLAFASVVLLTLGYQVQTSYLIDVGTKNDRPFIVSFNSPEKVEAIPFRWSQRASQVVLTGLGSGAAGRLTLQLRGYRPDNIAPRVTLYVNGQRLATVRPENSFREYSFALAGPVFQRSDLVIQIRSQTFSTENDLRQLGIMVDTVRVDPPERWQWVTPAWNQVAWLTLGVVSIYLLMVALQSSRAAALGAGVGVLALSAGVIGWFRLWLTPISDTLVLNAWLAGAGAVGAYHLLRRVWGLALSGELGSRRAVRGLVLIMAFGIWFAYSGLVNPNFAPVDQIYRAHLMGELIQNRPRAISFYFTNPQSDAWGGSFVFPYPPTFDILLAPLRAVAPDDSQLVPLLNLAAAVLYASSVLPLYFLTLKIMPGDGRAGLVAATAWVVMPLSFLPLSDGAFPNILGQWFALIFLAALAGLYERMGEPRVFVALSILLFFTFMAYSPTLLFMLLLLGLVLVVRAFAAHSRQERERVRDLFLIVTVALLGAGIVYYGPFLGAFLFGTIPAMVARLGQAGAIGHSPFMNGGWALPQELSAHFRFIPVGAAIAALWFMRPIQSTARWVYVLAFIAFLPFGVAENWINLYNKHMLFILPFVAVGTGILLSMVWRRGWIGRGFVLAVMGYLTYAGMEVWFQRVYFYVLPAGSGIEKFFGN